MPAWTSFPLKVAHLSQTLIAPLLLVLLLDCPPPLLLHQPKKSNGDHPLLLLLLLHRRCRRWIIRRPHRLTDGRTRHSPPRWEADAERWFVFPRSGQPFSGSGTAIEEPSRAVQYPRGLRNAEPPIAANSRGGRQA